MHANGSARTNEAENSRSSAGTPTGRVKTPLPPLVALQSSAGNTAVVQMLRQAGHPWAQEGHRQSAGCGYQQSEQPVQRFIVPDVLRSPGRPLSDAAARPVQRMPQRGRSTVHGPGGPLDGIDSQGNYYRFDYRHVRSKALLDQARNLIGISFPTKPEDSSQVTEWARQPHRTSDVEVYNVTVSGDIRAPTFSVGSPEPAPWSDRPLYVHAHASNEFFDVPVAVDASTVMKIKVDGATFGRILRHNPGYQEAARNTSGPDGLLMACTSGHPSATAAADMAQYMHNHGSNRTWYAPIGMGARIHPLPGRPNTSGYGSTQTWDESGNEIAGSFVAYPPPPRQTSGSHPSNPSVNAPMPYSYNYVSHTPAPYPYDPYQGLPYGRP